MDAGQLKAVQGPLKEKYRDDPRAALITLRAEGHASGLVCKVETEQRATLLKLTERYCVVLQTLRTAPPITARIV